MRSSTPSSETFDAHLWVTVLAGGVGSRFWPVSTPARPKQLLPLAGDRPIVQDTVDRALSLAIAEHVLILSGGSVGDRIIESVPELGPEALLREPQGKGTAPALTWAAWEVSRRDPDAVLVSLHSDHVIQPPDAFQRVIGRARDIAVESDRLVTLGVAPNRAETGYGYVLPGVPLGQGIQPAAFEVGAFVEKPDRETAEQYVAEGYLWNSGIFVWKASVFLDEVRRVAPEISSLIPLLEQGDVNGFFESAPVIQVDVAVMERSDRVATVRAEFSWDDVGSWEALSRTREADPEGNVTVGDGWIVEGDGNIVYAEDGAVVLFGVDDLVVVRSGGVTLVTPRSRAAELKTLLAALPERLTQT